MKPSIPIYASYNMALRKRFMRGIILSLLLLMLILTLMVVL
jgi:hypothetical protein